MKTHACMVHRHASEAHLYILVASNVLGRSSIVVEIFLSVLIARDLHHLATVRC